MNKNIFIKLIRMVAWLRKGETRARKEYGDERTKQTNKIKEKLCIGQC
jgi:hypothetical protein